LLAGASRYIDAQANGWASIRGALSILRARSHVIAHETAHENWLVDEFLHRKKQESSKKKWNDSVPGAFLKARVKACSCGSS
jgi:hypothetical protein